MKIKVEQLDEHTQKITYDAEALGWLNRLGYLHSKETTYIIMHVILGMLIFFKIACIEAVQDIDTDVEGDLFKEN